MIRFHGCLTRSLLLPPNWPLTCGIQRGNVDGIEWDRPSIRQHEPVLA